MTSSYAETPETRINDLCKDVVVAGHLARAGRLTPEFADQLAERVKAASADMIEPGDAQLLRYTAAQLGAVSTGIRIKAGTAPGNGSRAKASNRSRTGSRPEPDYAALSRQQDLRDMASAGPFDRTEYEDVERKRAENANAVLRERRRKDELERRRHISPEPETPWWR